MAAVDVRWCTSQVELKPRESGVVTGTYAGTAHYDGVPPARSPAANLKSTICLPRAISSCDCAGEFHEVPCE